MSKPLLMKPILVTFMALTILIACPVLVGAQGPDLKWSKPTLIFQDTSPKAIVTDPSLVSDLRGYVYLFWNYTPSTDSPANVYLMYSWFDGSRWQTPNDILISPKGQSVGRPLVVLDEQQGLLYLVWGSDLYRAPIDAANRASAWSNPEAIGFHGTANAFYLDHQGMLYLAYTPFNALRGIGYLYSEDRGKTWTNDALIHGRENVAHYGPEMSVDVNGVVHLVWNDNDPSGWPPLGASYARSSDHGKNWSTPIQIVAKEGYGDVGIVAADNNAIHIVWKGTSQVGGTFHLWSPDGGRTWQGPKRIHEDGGFSGNQSFAVDSGGVVHLITSDAAEMYWQDQKWVVNDVNRDQCEISRAVVSLGNRLFLACTSTTGQSPNHNRIMLFSRNTGSLPLSPRALPTPPPIPTIAPTVTATLLPRGKDPGLRPIDTFSDVPSDTSASPVNGIALALVPVAVLLCAVILARGRR